MKFEEENLYKCDVISLLGGRVSQKLWLIHTSGASVENLKILPQEAKKYKLRLSLKYLFRYGIILLQ